MSNVFSGQNIEGRLDIFESTGSFSRPANTTAYADADGVADNVAASASSNVEFESCAINNGKSLRLDFVSITSDNAVTAPTLELWLFDESPTSQADNSAYTLTDAENNNCVGVIPLFTASSSDNNWRLEASNLNKIIKTGTNTTSLYGQLRTVGTYTPASGETFTFTIIGTYL